MVFLWGLVFFFVSVNADEINRVSPVKEDVSSIEREDTSPKTEKMALVPEPVPKDMSIPTPDYDSLQSKGLKEEKRLEQQRSEQRQLEREKELKRQKSLEKQRKLESQKRMEQERKAEF